MDPRLIAVLRNLYVHLKRSYNLPNIIPPEVKMEEELPLWLNAAANAGPFTRPRVCVCVCVCMCVYIYIYIYIFLYSYI